MSSLFPFQLASCESRQLRFTRSAPRRLAVDPISVPLEHKTLDSSTKPASLYLGSSTSPLHGLRGARGVDPNLPRAFSNQNATDGNSRVLDAIVNGSR